MQILKDDQTLKLAFLIGGIYDLILGFGLVFIPDIVIELIRVFFQFTKPDNMLFVQLTGLFLILIGYLLIYSCQDVKKYAFIGFGSTFVRFSYFIIAVFGLIGGNLETPYLLISFTDFLTGLFLLLTLLYNEDIPISKLWKDA